MPVSSLAPLRLAGTVPDSIVDGPGLRFVVFTQGCPHHCPGCHNSATWNPEGGYTTSAAEVLEEIRRRRDWLDGVTLSGGEPFRQAGALAELARECRALGLPVITYTGYTWEQLVDPLRRPADADRLLRELDLLVDGPFLLARKSLTLRFRGSANQRVIDVPASLRIGHALTTEFPAAAPTDHRAPADPWSLRTTPACRTS